MRNLTAELESMIDETSLLDVLTALELVCSERADINRANGAHKSVIQPWRTASNRIEKLARETDI